MRQNRRFPSSFFLLLPSLFFFAAACGGSAPPAESVVQVPPPADVAGPPADAVRTSSNLAYKVLQPGTGTRHPRPNSTVTVHYTGWTTDGKTFDSSVTRGQPATFSLDGVIPGWTEGVQMMVEGEKRRFWIPAKLAYEGQPDKPQGLLVFDIELIRIDS
jgi:peptidylprolyl isomerase